MSVSTATTGERPIWTLSTLGSLLRNERTLMLVLALFVGILSILPLGRLVYAAFVTGTGFELDRIADVLGGRHVFEATVNTIWISLSATALATVAGTIAALLVGASDMRGRTAWVFGFVLPLMIPPQVIALAWVQAFSPASPVMNLLGFSLQPGMRHPLYSAGGIVLLLGLCNAPLVFLAVRANLRRVPADLVEAARAVGATPLRATLGVILPLIRGGIFAGAALAFVSSIGNFGIQAMLGIPARVPTLITLIYRQLNSYGPSALNDMALLALLLAVLTILGMGTAGFLSRMGDQRVDGASRPFKFPLGHFRLPVTALAWGYLVFALALPLSALAGSALVRGYGQPLNLETLTFENFSNALFHHEGIREAFFTSLWLS